MSNQAATRRRTARLERQRSSGTRRPARPKSRSYRAHRAIVPLTSKPSDGKQAAPSIRARRGRILVGTASWTDPGFIKDWYPTTLPARQRLPWYAEHFNLVEVNSSFYAIPSPKQVANWCQQTPPDFVFDIKLHRLLARHSTQVDSLPRDLRPMAQTHKGRVQLTPKLETALTRRFLQAIAPFSEARKMGALLLQLSPSFSPRKHRLDELDSLLDLLGDYQVALELRIRNWVVDEELHKTIAYFKKHRIALVTVDGPEGDHFMIMPKVDVVTSPALPTCGRTAEMRPAISAVAPSPRALTMTMPRRSWRRLPNVPPTWRHSPPRRM